MHVQSAYHTRIASKQPAPERRSRRPSGRHRRPEAGASTAEYIVLIAVLVLAAVAGLTHLQSGAERGLGAEADDLHALALGEGYDRVDPGTASPGDDGEADPEPTGSASSGLTGPSGAPMGLGRTGPGPGGGPSPGPGGRTGPRGESPRGDWTSWSEQPAPLAPLVLQHETQGQVFEGVADFFAGLDEPDGDRREDGLLDSVAGLFIGIGEGATSLVSGVADMVVGLHNLSPVRALYDLEGWKQSWGNFGAGVKTMVTDPIGVLEAIVQPMVDDWKAGRPMEAIGRGAFEIVGVFIGTKGLDKVGKGGKVGQVVSKTGSSSKAGQIVSKTGPAHNAAEFAKYNSYLKQLEKYGKAGEKTLPNGRIRFYGELEMPRKPGPMEGWRKVREWDPATGQTRTWFETVDHKGNIRQVRPDEKITDGIKKHYTFDEDGNYKGWWTKKEPGGPKWWSK